MVPLLACPAVPTVTVGDICLKTVALIVHWPWPHQAELDEHCWTSQQWHPDGIYSSAEAVSIFLINVSYLLKARSTFLASESVSAPCFSES